jgi:hypothetical protein
MFVKPLANTSASPVVGLRGTRSRLRPGTGSPSVWLVERWVAAVRQGATFAAPNQRTVD